MTSDVDDPDSYLNQKYDAAYSDAVTKLTTKSNIELHAQVTSRIEAIDTELQDATLTTEERAALEEEKTTRQDQLTQLNQSCRRRTNGRRRLLQSRRNSQS